MPMDPVAKSGLTEQSDIQQRMTTPQLNHRECGPEHDAGRPCIPRRSGASSRVPALPRLRTRIPQARAPISTAPTQSSGVAVSSRDDLIVHVAMNRAMPEAANP